MHCTQIRAYDNDQSSDTFRSTYVSVCPAKPNLVRQIYYTLLIEKSLSLQMKNEYLNKHCNIKGIMTIQGGVTPQSFVINTHSCGQE